VGKVSISKKRTHTLMVSLLTLQRRAELALAEWKEFDFVAKEWHVPAKHDKMRRGHTVPLTNWTVAELMALKALCGTSRFVLPNRKGDGLVQVHHLQTSPGTSFTPVDSMLANRGGSLCPGTRPMRWINVVNL
jgi:integrase